MREEDLLMQRRGETSVRMKKMRVKEILKVAGSWGGLGSFEKWQQL